MKQVWLSNDGTVCDSQEQAAARDKAMDLHGEIENWVLARTNGGRRTKEYIKLLKDFVVRG